jgi:hypothetical protein
MTRTCRPGRVALVLTMVASAGCHLLLDSRDVGGRSEAMVLLDGAREVQYYRNHDLRGRQESEGISYVVDAEYPAGDVICRVATQLATNGWRPLSRTHEDLGTESSYLKGWRVIINRRNRSDEAHVDLWDAEWVNDDGDLLSYSLTYRYPTRGARNSSQMRVGAIRTPKWLAEQMERGRATTSERIPPGRGPRVTPDLAAECAGNARG